MADTTKAKIDTAVHNKPGSADHCLAEVMRELSGVAVGGSAKDVAVRIRENFPTSPEEITKFLGYSQRLREVTESMHQLAIGEEIARRH